MLSVLYAGMGIIAKVGANVVAFKEGEVVTAAPFTCALRVTAFVWLACKGWWGHKHHNNYLGRFASKADGRGDAQGNGTWQEYVVVRQGHLVSACMLCTDFLLQTGCSTCICYLPPSLASPALAWTWPLCEPCRAWCSLPAAMGQ